MPTQLSLDLICQRWTNRKASYRPLQEPINPEQFRVDVIQESVARLFVQANHYSSTFPAAIASIGLYEREGHFQERLVGVAVFSSPMNAKAADSYGAAGHSFCDLGRFVLLDHVGGNGETWFLRRAIAALKALKQRENGRPKYDLCLAYSDPTPRLKADGTLVFRGHYGGIYQSSALYLGRATPRNLWLAPDGTIVSERSLSKIRTGDRGSDGAYKRLVSLGAPPIRHGESSRDYLARALGEGPFRRIRHRGNHAYAIPAGNHKTRKIVRSLMRSDLPPPRRTDPLPTDNRPL